MASSMSTPINQLPANKPTTAVLPEDPEILNVLQEMEQEVSTAAKANSAPINTPPSNMTATPMPVAMPPQMMMPTASVTKKTCPVNKWINYDTMQHAIVVGLIALVAFYPSTMEYIYSVPKLAFLEQFDIIVRSAVVMVAVYVASIQFGL